jgi:ABC-type transporter Mla subunit MlaD
VDLDALLDSLDGKARHDIRTIFAQVAAANSPRVARQFNAGIHLANPAISQLTALGRELTSDEVALRSLISHSSSVVGALARQRQALGSSIDSSAGVLSAVASQRDQLVVALDRAPAAMRMTTHTLHRVRTRTLPLAQSVATAAEPGIKPLGKLLAITRPTLANALPVARRIRALLPRARRALLPLPRLQRAASPAVTSTSKALRAALPMITGLRAYTPDLEGGFFNGFGGTEGHAYDANGHYLRISAQLGAGTVSGVIPKPPSSDLGGTRTGLDARCPGGAEEPAPDRSNPFFDVPGICDPKDNHR